MKDKIPKLYNLYLAQQKHESDMKKLPFLIYSKNVLMLSDCQSGLQNLCNLELVCALLSIAAVLTYCLAYSNQSARPAAKT